MALNQDLKSHTQGSMALGPSQLRGSRVNQIPSVRLSFFGVIRQY